MKEEYDIVEDRGTINNSLEANKKLTRFAITALIVFFVCVLIFNIAYFFATDWFAKNEQIESSKKVNIGNTMGKTYQIEQKLKRDLEEKRIK